MTHHTVVAVTRHLIFCAVIALLIVRLPARADEQQPTPTTAPAAPAAPTVENIQARIKNVQEQSGLDEALKSRILETLNQALADLARADEWAVLVAEYEKQRASAPGSVEEIRVATTQPVEDPKIEIAPDVKLADLEKQMAQVVAELKSARDRFKVLDDEVNARPERVKAIPDLMAKARKDLEDLNNALAGPPPADEPAEQAAARRIARLARVKSLEAELEALKQDLERGDLLEALRDHAARRVAIAEKLVKAWEVIVNDRRRAEVEKATEAAKDLEKEAATAHPIVSELAKEIADLAKERSEIVSKLEQVGARIEQVNEQIKQIQERAGTIARKVEAAGLSPQLALVLRRYREELPNVRDVRRRLAERRLEMSKVDVRLIELNELTDKSKSVAVQVRERLSSLDPKTPKEQKDQIKKQVRELLESRKAFVDDLKADYNRYFVRIGGPDGVVEKQQVLLREAESFANYINERILWIRSTNTPEWKDIEYGYDALLWLTNASNWKSAWASFQETLLKNLVEASIGGLFFLLLVLAQPRLRRELRSTGQIVSKSYSATFTPTVESVIVTIFVAMPAPALLVTVGWLAGTPYDATDFTKAVSRGLTVSAIPLFAIEVLRQACRPNGLAEAHYGWPSRLVKMIRRNCLWLLAFGVPLVFIYASIDWTSKDLWQRSLGRAAFIVGEILLMVFLYRVLHTATGALAETRWLEVPGWKSRLLRLAYFLVVALPLALAVLALMGYLYTAVEVAIRFQRLIWLSFAIILLYAFGLRWLLVSRRKLAIEQARQRRAAEEAARAQISEKEDSADADTLATATETPAEPTIDLSSLNIQTRAILRAAAVICFLVGFWIVWVDVVPALRMFDSVRLWATKVVVTETIEGADGQLSTLTAERHIWITLSDLGFAVLCLLAAIIATKNLPGLLEIGVLRKTDLGAGERYAITTISKYIITVLGIVIAFKAIGIGWSEVQWLAAAITVGLGFGLQEIFANFVSGLIILFERPIRVGDIVTVGGVDGRVTRIQMRATTIMNWDRKELIIPNKEFVTGQVINWTLTDEIMRVVINVGIAYGSDTRLARDLILKVARGNPRVLNEPEPRVVFRQFGSSSLDFQLRCFVKNTDDFVTVGDALHYEIDDEFRKAGIEIAFPQMDLHLRDVPREMVSQGLTA